jgi:hypothetical protein
MLMLRKSLGILIRTKINIDQCVLEEAFHSIWKRSQRFQLESKLLNKPRSTLLTRRSSFSSSQVEENSNSRNNGKLLSFAPLSLKVTGNLAIKKTSPRCPGPIKAVPMP